MARKNNNASVGGDRQRHKPKCACRYCRAAKFKKNALEANHERGR